MKNDLMAWFLDLYQDYLSKQAQVFEHSEYDAQDEADDIENNFLFIKLQHPGSYRALTDYEQEKLDTVCHQCLLQLQQWQLINTLEAEVILERAMQSESPSVGIEEFKWLILTSFEEEGDKERLCFLESILYHDENHAKSCH